MHIHLMRTVKHPFKIVHADNNRYWKADCGPHRIAAADKIPEFKHIFRINAEFFNLFDIGWNRNEMFGNRMFAQSVDQPFAAGFGIGQRLNRCKGLWWNDKQGCFRIDFVQNFATGSSVNVGNEITVKVFSPIFAQCFGCHFRPQIRSSDADVYDIRQLLAGLPRKLSQPYGFRKLAHFSQYRIDFRHHVLAVDINRCIAAVTQGNVQNRAMFGNVNSFAAKHLFDFLIKFALFGQSQQIFHGTVIDTVFGVIQH